MERTDRVFTRTPSRSDRWNPQHLLLGTLGTWVWLQLDHLQFIALTAMFPSFFLPPFSFLTAIMMSPLNFFISTPVVDSFASASNISVAGVSWFSQAVMIPHTALQLTADIFIAGLLIVSVMIYGIISLIVYLCNMNEADRVGESIRAYAVAVVVRVAMTPFYALGVSCAYHLVTFVKPEPMYFVAAIIAVVILVIPVILGAGVFSRRLVLFEPDSQARLGGLYYKFNKSNYLWFVVTVYKRLTFAALLGALSDSPFYCFPVLIALQAVYCIALAWRRPFTSRVIFGVELALEISYLWDTIGAYVAVYYPPYGGAADLGLGIVAVVVHCIIAFVLVVLIVASLVFVFRDLCQGRYRSRLLGLPTTTVTQMERLESPLNGSPAPSEGGGATPILPPGSPLSFQGLLNQRAPTPPLGAFPLPSLQPQKQALFSDFLSDEKTPQMSLHEHITDVPSSIPAVEDVEEHGRVSHPSAAQTSSFNTHFERTSATTTTTSNQSGVSFASALQQQQQQSGSPRNGSPRGSVVSIPASVSVPVPPTPSALSLGQLNLNRSFNAPPPTPSVERTFRRPSNAFDLFPTTYHSPIHSSNDSVEVEEISTAVVSPSIQLVNPQFTLPPSSAPTLQFPATLQSPQSQPTFPKPHSPPRSPGTVTPPSNSAPQPFNAGGTQRMSLLARRMLNSAGGIAIPPSTVSPMGTGAVVNESALGATSLMSPPPRPDVENGAVSAPMTPKAPNQFQQHRRSMMIPMNLQLNTQSFSAEATQKMTQEMIEKQEKEKEMEYFDSVCSQIVEGCYVGSYALASNLGLLRDSHITHIVNCVGHTLSNNFPDQFQYLTLQLADSPAECISAVFYEVLDFVRQARSDSGRVMIHCKHGISRSAALALCYVMFSTKENFDRAREILLRSRSICNPNGGFIFQLQEWHERFSKFTNPSTVFSVEDSRLYRICPQSRRLGVPVKLVAKPHCDTSGKPVMDASALDPRAVFVVQPPPPRQVWIWVGDLASPSHVNAARVHVWRLQRYEQAPKLYRVVKQGHEPDEFWSCFTTQSPRSPRDSLPGTPRGRTTVATLHKEYDLDFSDPSHSPTWQPLPAVLYRAPSFSRVQPFSALDFTSDALLVLLTASSVAAIDPINTKIFIFVGCEVELGDESFADMCNRMVRVWKTVVGYKGEINFQAVAQASDAPALWAYVPR